MTRDKSLRSGGAYRFDRKVGIACGISMEVWRKVGDNQAVLVATPTIEGFTIFGAGAESDVDYLAALGDQMVDLLRTTGPLLTGSHFHTK